MPQIIVWTRRVANWTLRRRLAEAQQDVERFERRLRLQRIQTA